MSKEEILAELPLLSANERAEILDELLRIEGIAGPTEMEKALLSEAQGDYDANPADGKTWPEIEARLRRK